MTRAWLAAGAEAVFVGVAIGGRAWIQRRWTGASGIVGIRRSPGAAAKAAGLLFGAALVGLGMAPALALGGAVTPVSIHAHWPVIAAGCLVVLGTAGTVWAQYAMGPSWRIGVDASERTELVTTGPFRWVRNPIYSCMAAFDAGIAVLVPSVLSLVALGSVLVAIELQVRLVEEPFLRGLHGDEYQEWAAGTGRFVPRAPRAGLA